jgi:hypothetical protein
VPIADEAGKKAIVPEEQGSVQYGWIPEGQPHQKFAALRARA